ncbi:MAG: hypothetical protein ACFFDH_11885 [Promethearchaeota archaeon]
MDCYDEILNRVQDTNQINKFTEYLTDLINKKSKNLTELQFKNCLVLTLAIWSPKFIDLYFSEGKKINQLKINKKLKLIELLKSEFRVLDN